MKLSDKTIETIKNFSVINSGVWFRVGKEQATISPEKAIFAKATFEEEIPKEFGIYDLPQLLGLLSSLNNPTIEFEESYLIITDGDDDVKLKYFYCSPEVVTIPKSVDDLKMKSVDIEFDLTEKVFSKLIKLASILQLPNLAIFGQNGSLIVGATDPSNTTSNDAMIKIGDYTGEDFKVVFKIENLKIVPENYHVSIWFKNYALFENEAKTRKYYISVIKQKE